MLSGVELKYIPNEDSDAHRRRTIRFGRRCTARRLAEAPGSPRREALEAADRAEANGMVHEAAYQRQVADELIPMHLRWAFEQDWD